MKYNLVSENPLSTVVAEFQVKYEREKSYQSEAELEKTFIKQLESQAYEYLAINSETDLVLNLCQQLQKLNHINFSDTEWENFFVSVIANPNRDDGSFLNIDLIDKKDIHIIKN